MNEWKEMLDAARAVTAQPAEFRRLARRARQMLRSGSRPEGARPVRLALLGRSTLDTLAPQLELALLARGIAPEISDRSVRIVHAGADRSRERHRSKFVPQFAVVVLTPFDIPEWPSSFATVPGS